MKKLRVLFHINEREKWDLILMSIATFIREVGEECADIVVVANWTAILAYTDEEKVEIIRGLADQGVTFHACRYSLTKMCADNNVCVREQDIPKFIKVVPVGITEIIMRQHDGYAYVKP